MNQYKQIAIPARSPVITRSRLFSISPRPLSSSKTIPTDTVDRLRLLVEVSGLPEHHESTREELKMYFPLRRQGMLFHGKNPVLRSPSKDHLVVVEKGVIEVGKGHISSAIEAHARIESCRPPITVEDVDAVDKESTLYNPSSQGLEKCWNWIMFVRSILIQQMAQLAAPGRVAHIYGWYRSKGPDHLDIGHIVMERLPGVPLNQVLALNEHEWGIPEKRGQLVQQKKEIVYLIALALAELNRGGVVQNDLNTSNFLVEIEPESGKIAGLRVLDFECAYMVHGPGGSEDEFRDPLRNQVRGIRKYWSTHQFQNSNSLTFGQTREIGFRDEIQSYARLLADVLEGEDVSISHFLNAENRSLRSHYGEGYLALIKSLWETPESWTMAQVAARLNELMTPAQGSEASALKDEH